MLLAELNPQIYLESENKKSPTQQFQTHRFCDTFLVFSCFLSKSEKLFFSCFMFFKGLVNPLLTKFECQ